MTDRDENDDSPFMGGHAMELIVALYGLAAIAGWIGWHVIQVCKYWMGG